MPWNLVHACIGEAKIELHSGQANQISYPSALGAFGEGVAEEGKRIFAEFLQMRVNYSALFEHTFTSP